MRIALGLLLLVLLSGCASTHPCANTVGRVMIGLTADFGACPPRLSHQPSQ